jgi:hypothetical protein
MERWTEREIERRTNRHNNGRRKLKQMDRQKIIIWREREMER